MQMPPMMRMPMQKPPPTEEFALKETKPHLGGGNMTGDKVTSTYDLVEQMQYLYVRVVKAKELPAKDVTGSCDPYVEVRLGNYKGTTKHFEKKSNPEWNQVFAFSKDRIQATYLEVVVKDKDFVRDDFIGQHGFDLGEIPTRVPPDSPLAPQWYRLMDRKGDKAASGELMLAVWWGTQADEAFTEAWHSDAAALSGGSDAIANIRSKVYLSPKLWYLRVNVIEAQDLMIMDKGRYPEVYVKAILGNQVMRTRISQSRSINPMWNEDLMFVVAEPFEEPLILSVEDRVGPNKEEVIGRCGIPLQYVDRRLDHRAVNARWFSLEKQHHMVVNNVEGGGEKKKETKFASRIHMRICLEGGYHVLDESTPYSSDLRATAKQLWKPSIGVLELGILNAHGLVPMKANNNNNDGRQSTDAYCVAKYGQKWVRTRTIIDSFSPKWNEQYTWEVYDPCTVLTVGVFDNSHLQLHGGGDKGGNNGGGGGGGGASRDLRIGKVRIRLSTLETDRVYTHSYPLLLLHSGGVKKMGEIQLAVRFTCSSLLNMMHMYTQPLLPKMHYLHPLTVIQLDNLRHQATHIVSMRLSRAEPPLRKEVVEYMLDVGSNMWSMRRSKANFFRIVGVVQKLFAVGRWFDQVCNWKNPITTVLVHVAFLVLVLYPELILPTLFFYLFLIGVWYYRWRPRHPSHMDTRLSHAENAHPEELDEEFDTFPTSKAADVVRMRYDRLRSVAGRIQTVVGDLANQAERLQSLLSWRDPRATALFVIFCLVAAIVLYVTPFQVVLLCTGFYMLRHPRFRHKLPSVPINFFRRLPSRADSML
ncbi:FT-interacting protein 3 [Dionaea muscipula]